MRERNAAVQKAAWAALRAGMLPQTFRSLVERHDVEHHTYHRVAYEIERRVVELELEPAHGSRQQHVRMLPSAASVDPWRVDPAHLPGATRTLATCPTCDGEKKVLCGTCDGDGRLRCGTCYGSGRVRGERGTKNCPTCRANGTVRCPDCSRGKVVCGSCRGVGRVYAQLAIQAVRSIQIRIFPPNGIAAIHDNLQALHDFDRDPRAYRIPLVEDSGWVVAQPHGLPVELAPALDAFADRCLRQRIQRFGGPVHVLSYSTGTAQGVVRVAGRPPAVLGESDWGPAKHRLGFSVLAGVGMALVALMTTGAYLSRADWFQQHGNGGAIALLGLAAAALTPRVVMGLWLPKHRRTLWRSTMPVLAWLLLWIAILPLWFVGGPSLDSVQASLTAVDLKEARLELSALERLAPSAPGLVDAKVRLSELEAEQRHREELAHDEARFEQIQNASSAVAAADLLAQEWKTDEVRPRAREVVLARAAADHDAFLQSGDEKRLVALADAMRMLDQPLASRAASRSLLARASTCHASGDLACAAETLEQWRPMDGDEAAVRRGDELRSSLRGDLEAAIENANIDDADLRARKRTLEQTLGLATHYQTLAGVASSPSVETLEARLAKTNRQIQVENEKVERAQAKRRKAEEAKARRAAAQRQQQQARERRVSDRVRCCDGTLSPSCRYSQGSLRGCCSHHRGVC